MAMREKRKVIPLPTHRGNPYNAEVEREKNIIGNRITEARKDKKLSMAAFSDLLASYGVNVAASGIGKVILPFAILLVIAILAFAVLLYVKSTLESELKKIKDYNSSPDTLEQVAEYDAMYDNMAEIGTIQGGVDMLERDLASYPIPDSSVNEMILAAAQRRNVTVDFKSYSASTGVFSITASSPTVDAINQFIGDLLDMDIFENVDYTGYTLDSDGENWTINVVCSLASPDIPAEDAEEEVG